MEPVMSDIWRNPGDTASGISSEQGVDAFCRVLSQRGEAQVAVSPYSVARLLAGDRQARIAARDSSDGVRQPEPPAVEHRHLRPTLQTPFVEPRSAAERAICALWGDSLGLNRVGIYDSFFDLGGHSLLAVRVMARINDELGADIPVAKLYEGLTARFLAELIEGAAQNMGGDDDTDLAERRSEKARRQKAHQDRRRVVMGR